MGQRPTGSLIQDFPIQSLTETLLRSPELPEGETSLTDTSLVSPQTHQCPMCSNMSEGAEFYNYKHCQVLTGPGAKERPVGVKDPWWVLGDIGHELQHELLLIHPHPIHLQTETQMLMDGCLHPFMVKDQRKFGSGSHDPVDQMHDVSALHLKCLTSGSLSQGAPQLLEHTQRPEG